MVQQKLTDDRELFSDLVIRADENLIVYESAIIHNPNAAAYADVQLFGMPVGNLTRVDKDHYTADLLLTAGSGNVEGIIVERYQHSFDVNTGAADDTPDRVRVLARGPAVVNVDKIAADDPAGAAYDKDAIRDALPALGITPRYEPEVVEVAPGP